MEYSNRQSLQSPLNIAITAALSFAPYIPTEGIADTNAEAGERELIVDRHLQVIGEDFSFIRRNEEVVDIQTETEFIVQRYSSPASTP